MLIPTAVTASQSTQAATGPSLPETILLIDPDAYTSGLLLTVLNNMGYAEVVIAHSAVEVSSLLARQAIAAVVLNFQSDRHDMLACCATAKLADPKLPVVVITAPGPTLAGVRRWQADTHSIDAIVEKPLREGRLLQILGALVASRRAVQRSDRLARLMPSEAAQAVDGSDAPTMIEQAVLFTDLRRSTQLAVSLGPRLLFERVNAALSAQAQVVRKSGGSVTKFTGDGLMATFRGSGRNHLALRCALALQPLSVVPGALPFGIGLASGLTIAGFIGEADQRHYDVIGATVHLAARLCAMAGPSELVSTAQAVGRSALGVDHHQDLGNIAVRGFEEEIHCIAFVVPQSTIVS